jgi:uncharacterized protein with HEPN domain
MSQRDDLALLRDALDAARAASSAIQGHRREDLAADPIWALGLVKCLEIIDEATSRLSVDLRSRHPDVPWAKIIGMRNRLVHA